MANGIKYPPAGSKVRVYTKDFMYAYMNEYRVRWFEGIVQASRDQQSITLIRKDHWHNPFIEWGRVEKIEYLDEDGKPIGSETPVEAQEEPEDTGKQTWEVSGSKGKTYTVTKDGDVWSCTCVAGGFGRLCKHVQAKKAELSAA